MRGLELERDALRRPHDRERDRERGEIGAGDDLADPRLGECEDLVRVGRVHRRGTSFIRR